MPRSEFPKRQPDLSESQRSLFQKADLAEGRP